MFICDFCERVLSDQIHLVRHLAECRSRINHLALEKYHRKQLEELGRYEDCTHALSDIREQMVDLNTKMELILQQNEQILAMTDAKSKKFLFPQ
jgi:hypothetical protein